MERRQPSPSDPNKDRKLSAARLTKGDSGFFSPAETPAGVTPQTPSRPDMMSLQAQQQQPQRQSGAPALNTPSPGSIIHHSLTEASIKHYRHQLELQEQKYLQRMAEAKSAPVNNAPSSQQPPALEDDLLMAFQCRESDQTAWNSCGHPYCALTRTQWQHFKRCLHFQGISSQQCERCTGFQKKVLEHAKSCHEEECPVTLCADAKTQIEQFSATNATTRPQLKRSQSFHEKYDLLTRRELTRAGIHSSDSISDRVQEILKKFDQKKPDEDDEIEEYYTADSSSVKRTGFQSLPQIPISSAIVSKPVVGGAGEQGGGAAVYQQPSASQQPVLSPIAEQPGKEESVTPVSGTPRSLGFDETLAECRARKHPTQTLLHPLNREYLLPNEDSFYFQHREYYLNDVSTLGQGGFGTCVSGQDSRTSTMFAMKRNNVNDEDKIDSIRSECRVLSRLKSHEHVVRFFGAVLDEEEDNVCLPRVCKMIMELSENGNLAEMLVDEDNQPLPLPHDQSLYYLEQILQGVFFLHASNVLHLDIKPHNVLVFDNGRTVKLADFGSAVHKDELTGLGISKGWSPHFAAPEVIRQEMPSFSSDIWSVMCVLVHMVTGDLPAGHCSMSHESMMFLVGSYKEGDINKIIPLDTLQMDDDIAELFTMVFTNKQMERPSAFKLLQHPRIKEACDYVKFFDDDFPDDCDYEDEYSQEPAGQEGVRPVDLEDSFQTAPQYLPLVPLEPDKAASEPLPRQTSADSGMGSVCGWVARSSISGSSGYTPNFRTSYDSAMGGTPLEAQAGAFNFEAAVQKPSTEAAKEPSSRNPVGHAPSEPGHASIRPRSATLPQGREFQSLPARLIKDDLADTMERSLSLNDSGSVPVHKRQRPSSIQPLTHSNSVPSLMNDLKRRRRLSLQTLPSGGGGSNDSLTDCERDGVYPQQRTLRRTSSEVYVDRGPDIDTPEEKRQALLEGLPIFTVQPPSLERSAGGQPTSSSSDGGGGGGDTDSQPSTTATSESSSSTSFASARAFFRSLSKSAESSSSDGCPSPGPSYHQQQRAGGPNAAATDTSCNSNTGSQPATSHGGISGSHSKKGRSGGDQPGIFQTI